MAQSPLSNPAALRDTPLTDSPRFIFWLYTWFIVSPILLAFLDAVFHTHDFWFGPLFRLIEDNVNVYAAHFLHYLTYYIPSAILLCLAPLTKFGRVTMFLSWTLIDAVPVLFVYYFTTSSIAQSCTRLANGG